jgi:hypothetical protein
MNKAFVREPDPLGDGRCPACGSAGTPVGAVTLDAQLPPQVRRGLGDAAWFCPYSRCDVVYFDMFERTVRAAALGRPVSPKALDAPLCACFGLSRDDVEADVREGAPRRVRDLLAKARSAEARCETAAASGRSCVADVQRYYLRLLQDGRGPQRSS